MRYIHIDLIFFSLFFSLFFCFFFSFVDSLVMFWIFLELCGLSIIPSLFYINDFYVYGIYNSLFTYVIVSGISSVLIITGILFFGLYYFVLFGFLLKLGLFPFSLWVYQVFNNSNWIFIFFLSVVLKFPVLFFCYVFVLSDMFIIFIDCSLTLLMCAIFFWGYSWSWECMWCHISLSSVSVLFIASFCSNFSLCFFIYFYYFIWALLCCLYFNYISNGNSIFCNFWMFCFLLLITPVSLPLFYKLSSCVAVFFSSSIYFLLSWCFYNFSEQFFLFKLAGDIFYSNSYNFWVF